MIKCAYCEYEARRNSGMAMHLRQVHPEQWRNSLKESWPEGYNPGEQEPMIRHEKTTKKGKVPAPTKCPFCGHEARRAQGLAVHLKGSHPDKWKGNMGDTLGIGPSRKWTKNERRSKTKRKNLGHDRFLPEGQEHEARAFINHCPGCGTNLVPYYLAAGIANRQ